MENQGAEYMLVNDVLGLGNNKADNMNIPQPSKCLKFSDSNAAKELLHALRLRR